MQRETKEPDGTRAQPPREPPRGPSSVQQSLAVWLFGGLLLAFLFAVFFFAPPVLPDYKHYILGLCAALLAGLFGWFLGGEIDLHADALPSRFGGLKIRAGGGAALFVLVLLWWLSPLAPVQTKSEPSSAPPSPLAPVQTESEPSAPPSRLQTLAGTVRDGKTGEPLANVQVALPAYGVTGQSNQFGRFEIQVAGPDQSSVELMARKAGYRIHEQYATLGNHSLDLDLEENAP